MATSQQAHSATTRAKLRNSTSVLLVGNIEPTMAWYQRLGFTPEYFPPGFAILRRDEIQIFLQQQPNYVKPADPGRIEREAWDLYILTDNLNLLQEEFTALGLELSRPPCPQDYGMVEFDLMDLNSYRLVFAQPWPPANGASA